MADIRTVTDTFSVAPQLSPVELTTAATLGFSLVINNRPDGESPDQPSAAEMEVAARAQGMDYLHIPVVGGATPDQVQQMTSAIVRAEGKVLAFCRSGTRSITTWCLGRAEAGDDPRELVDLAARAGYDLSGLLGP